MKHSVIVADDSQTIQKVIAITLSGEPYEISECLDVKNLNDSINTINPKLVLLDFNLSDDKTGYDLCKEIKAINPEVMVVYLFGTFDTIDEDLIAESGANDWIVKPFDGNKFINLCRALLTGDSSFETSNEETSKEETEEEWVMDVPQKMDESNEVNALESSMQDWGIEVPGVIGQGLASVGEIPGIISSEETNEDEIKEVETKSDHYPDSEDLEYPDLEEVTSKPTLELTPLNELKLDDAAVESNAMFNAQRSEEITDVNLIREQIEDEVEDLWSLDEAPEEDTSAEELSEVVKLHDVPADFPQDVMDETPIVSEEITSEDEISFSVQETIAEEKVEVETAASIDMDELIKKLRPMIEDVVREECKKISEKVSWEVIPDLAENLIKQEIQKISNQVLDH